MSSKHLKHYDTFNTALKLVLRSGFWNVKGKIPTSVCVKDDGTGDVETHLHLKGWPRSSSALPTNTRNSVSILIRANERFAKGTSGLLLQKSLVKLTYFSISDNDAIPLESAHFDYDAEQKSAHPLFHMQLCHDCIEDSSNFPSFRYSIDHQHPSIDARRKGCLFAFRIPTPQMGLCAVLLNLVADHLPPDTFSMLAKKLSRSNWTPPRPESNPVMNRIENGQYDCLHNLLWYP